MSMKSNASVYNNKVQKPNLFSSGGVGYHRWKDTRNMVKHFILSWIHSYSGEKNDNNGDKVHNAHI